VPVQFIHRSFAYAVVVLVGYIWFVSSKEILNPFQRKTIYFLLMMVLLQFALGIFILLFLVPVWLGVFHQLGALVLLTGSVFLSYSTPLKQ
jgi:cytochrome c oxidase assembly protein subunit 15